MKHIFEKINNRKLQCGGNMQLKLEVPMPGRCLVRKLTLQGQAVSFDGTILLLKFITIVVREANNLPASPHIDYLPGQCHTLLEKTS